MTDETTALIDAARNGDEVAYRDLVTPHRAELHAYCYRLTGSSADADDALQEALLGAWRGLANFEGRSSVRTWLYRITTNACLKLIERRPQRVLPVDFGPAADPHDVARGRFEDVPWLEPYPAAELVAAAILDSPETRYDRLESVELAFVAALQHLPANQRAVLVLRDVLGYSGEETADLLGTSTTSVYSSLQRAHRSVSERVPEQSQQAVLRAIDDDELATLIKRYVQAWDDGDVNALVELLTVDTTFSMPPMPEWYAGRDDVIEFLLRRPFGAQRRWRVIPTRANGQLAFGHYLWDDPQQAFLAHSVNLVELAGTRITNQVTFFRPDLFPELGLPSGAS